MLDMPVTRDPAAAQANAARLRAAADTVAALAQRLDHRVDAMTFTGPAAMRFRAAMTERVQRARRLSAELEAAADRVTRLHADTTA